ncbi:hypothetical protein [Methylovulum miyakonense]|uniref:hypothetical protein n=1 Tax=Methylovulum miyakonense TaxID=645578 RepID=UPI00035D84AA|nr:hypothetical protein [Methylovulum miyakonense]
MSFLVVKKETMGAVALVLMATILCGFLNTRGALLFVGLFSLALLFVLRSSIARIFINRPSIFVLYFMVLASTTYSYFLGLEISIWQIVRSQIWTLISIPLGLASYYYANSINAITIKMIVRFVEVWITMVSVLVIIELLTGIPISPAMIRSDLDSEIRLYIIGSNIGLFFLPVFLYMKKYIISFLSIFLVGITGGKTAMFLVFMYIVFSVFTIKGGRGKVVKLIAIPLFVVTLFFLSMYLHRIDDYIEHGDSWRHSQIIAAYNLWSSSFKTTLFGIGMGVPYWDGFLGSLNDDPVIVNSRFDIENGYLYLLTRFGAVGSILYLYLTLIHWGRYNILFIIDILVWWMGGSPSGGSVAITFVSFGISAGIFSYLISIDHLYPSKKY